MDGKILVTAKVNPDLDGTSCALAYADLLKQQGKEAEGLVFGSPQSETQYFIQEHHIEVPTADLDFISSWGEFVLVDASSMKGMPKPVDPRRVVEIIDHRKGEPEKEFPNAKIQNELIGAAATLVVERFIKDGKMPQPDHAKLLYGAIYHNTLNFTSFNTSDRDRHAVKYLEKEFNLDSRIAREMFEFATKEIEADVKLAIKNDAKEFGSGHTIGAYQLIVSGPGVLDQRGKLEAGVQELFQSSGAKWAFLNVVDLENKHSHIYATNPESQTVLENALGAKFSKNWAELPIVWLRKQIMPKIQEVVNAS